MTVKLVKKVIKKGKSRAKTVTKSEPIPSFFRFFESPVLPDLDDPEVQATVERNEIMAVRAARVRCGLGPVCIVVTCIACAAVASIGDATTTPSHLLRPLQLYEQIEAEANVGFALRNKIIPNAVQWFTGEADDDEDDDDDDDEDDEDGKERADPLHASDRLRRATFANLRNSKIHLHRNIAQVTTTRKMTRPTSSRMRWTRRKMTRRRRSLSRAAVRGAARAAGAGVASAEAVMTLPTSSRPR